jgi:hypothetical protein
MLHVNCINADDIVAESSTTQGNGVAAVSLAGSRSTWITKLNAFSVMEGGTPALYVGVFGTDTVSETFAVTDSANLILLGMLNILPVYQNC